MIHLNALCGQNAEFVDVGGDIYIYIGLYIYMLLAMYEKWACTELPGVFGQSIKYPNYFNITYILSLKR
jgi:hypothetical protein